MATTITDKAGLQAMKDTLDGDFVLGDDIDASGTGSGFEPVGTSATPFTGTFVGTGYTITDLFIDRDTTDYVGLFGYTDGVTITDAILTGVDITGKYVVGALVGYAEDSTISGCSTTGTVTGDDCVGGLIGYDDGSTISDCSSSCIVSVGVNIGGLIGYADQSDIDDCYATGAVSGGNYVGGLVGFGYGADFLNCYATGAITETGVGQTGGLLGYDWGSTIVKCYATGAVSGTDAIAGFVGGFNASTISKCYATGNVTATEASSGGAGGFAGISISTGTTFTDCYARGTVDCDDVADYDGVGGFIGYLIAGNTITNCYSTGAPTGDDDVLGFCGSNAGTITACFWDTETSGTDTADGGTGKTTSQMTTASTFIAGGWDFCTIWNRNDEYNDEYPYLRWQALAGEGETRSATIGPVYDNKGRVPKGARVEAHRADTGAVVETEYLDSNGKATFSDLPNDMNVTYWAVWGGTAQALKTEQFSSTIIPVTEGGTGSSDAANARSNLGLGSEDSPQHKELNLGHASDTTITRVSAAKIAVEGTVLTRAANYVVAANGAPTHVKAQADYVCDATDDHVQIQAAMDALPATGGKVLLTEGTFNVESAITLDSYQNLQGMGRNTILTTTTADVDIITATGSSGSEKTGILLTDFCVDGNAGGETNDYGIKWTYVDFSKINNVYSRDNDEDGIYLSYCDHNNISENVCLANTENITLVNSNNNQVAENICNDSAVDRGIQILTSNYNYVSGNVCRGNANAGIYLTTSTGNIVDGNLCNENFIGIYLSGTNVGIVVVDNVCQGNSADGILVSSSSNNTVISNFCTENSQDTTDTDDDICLTTNSDYNTVQSNICRAGSLTNKPKYGINIATDTCNGNTILNNDLYNDGFGTGAYNDDGTGTIYLDPETTVTAVGQAHTQGTDTTLGTLTADINMGGKDITNLNTSGGNAVGSTTATWSLYVDAGSGSDENAGTSGSPKATIQGALDVLPINIAHAGSIKVRGQQNYAESNTELEFSRFNTLAYITIEAVNSSDEDMFDSGTADAGAGNNELDDATKDWSVDQFNGAYVWIYHGTGEGQIREISDTTATKLTVTVNWTTNPDGTSLYVIGGGATMTGTNSYHVNNISKLIKVYGFKHTGATAADLVTLLGGNMWMRYNYCASSVRGIIIGDEHVCYPFFNYIAATTDGMNIQGISQATVWSNVIAGATNGIYLKYSSIANMSATAANQNHIMNCTTGIKIDVGSGCPNAGSQSFGAGGDANGADIDPAVSTTIPRWHN